MGDNKTFYYNRQGGVMEIRIRDSDGRIVERMKASCNDRRKCAKILNHVKEKYGFDFTPSIKEKKENPFQKGVWFDQ